MKAVLSDMLNLMKYQEEQRVTVFHPEFNPQYMRQKQAAEETLEFITKNAPDALLLADKPQILTYIMQKFANKEFDSNGLFLEFGVYVGTSINLCSSILPNVKFYGFDSFKGLPEDWSGWRTIKDRFDLKNNLPIVNRNVELVEGWFDETLPKFLNEHPQNVAFLHIDCDIYSSTKTIFDNLAGRIKKGTIIEFDEYINVPNWQNHEHKAFQEFCEAHNIKYRYIAFGFCQMCVEIL